MIDRTKQLNYPSIKQYTAYDNNNLLNITIHVSLRSGIDKEVFLFYANEIKKDAVNADMILSSMPVVKLKFSDIKVRRINPNKHWTDTLKESFDYDKQEKLESEREETGKPPFPNDLCFISNCPLYNKAYVLEVKYSKYNEEVVSKILVSPFLYNNYLDNSYRQFVKNHIFKNRFTIKTLGIVDYPRKELEVVESMENICPHKKNILKCFSKNKGILTDIGIFTVDFEKDIVYRGVSHFTDKEVSAVNNTRIKIFQLGI